MATSMPDEKAVMTYVSSYYHCFLGMRKVFFQLFLALSLPVESHSVHVG